MEEIFKVYKESYNRRYGHRVYEVSNFGRVKMNGVLIEFDEKQRYYAIGGFCVHRAVAELFIPNPDNKPYVDHIDTNPHNNVVWNLRWVTPKENSNNPLTMQHKSESQSRLEVRQKRSESLKNFWSNPEHRKKQSESQKVAQNRPETRQKISESSKKIWNDPEYRKKQSESHKGKNNPMYGKPSTTKGKHRVYNDPNDHTAGYHYE